jgi:hypothetical protein
MDKLRENLPTLLVAAGGALCIVCVLAGGLSYPNGLQVAVFVTLGIALGGVVMAVGHMLEHARSAAADSAQMRADIRVQTAALLEMTAVARESMAADA